MVASPSYPPSLLCPVQGFAYITFASAEGLQNALRMDGSEVAGQPLSVALAHQEVPEGQTEAFVLNIPPSADAAALETLFSVCGPIKSLRLPLDKDTSQIRVPLLWLSRSCRP